MGTLIPLRFPRLLSQIHLSLLVLGFLLCAPTWANQPALVISERAVIYADEQMSAPVGFVRKGKRIQVGSSARNKAQVYPIVVSGKIAYIRVVDVSTEMKAVGSEELVAERFKRVAEVEHETNYSLSFFNFSSQLTGAGDKAKKNSQDSLNWYGAGLRGGVKISPRWDFDVLVNFLRASEHGDAFQAVEVGAGASAYVLNLSRLRVKFYGQLLAIPFATYAVGDDFRVNGWGYSAGAGLNASYRLGRNFGLEAYGGFFYTKLSGFDPPKPYQAISPSFVGSRLGLGLVYQF